jgi:putative two-component system response regulator
MFTAPKSVTAPDHLYEPCVPFGAASGLAASPTTTSSIVVVDDTPINLKVISAYLNREGYTRVHTVSDSRDAVAALTRYDADLVLLDLMMPHVSGLDILEAMRETPHLRRIPVIVISAAEDREVKRRSLALGARDFLAKPIESEDLLLRVRNTLEMQSYQGSLEERILERTLALSQSREEVVHCLARAAEYRDNETGNHVIRVGSYVALMAERMEFDCDTCHMMDLASTLHDMGKLGVPDAILGKPGPLTEEERAVMREHCRIGAAICASDSRTLRGPFVSQLVTGAMMLKQATSPLLQMASRIALTHHERWDGDGYPDGLRGEEIAIEGRITAVADVFDALSSKRPYKEPFPLETCFAMIEAESGKHFDPEVVRVFLELKSQVAAVDLAYRDE